jgi:hypothetical protein
MAVSGLYTTVKNVSGKTRTFGFLGAHGKTLANNGTYSMPGDLVAKLGNQRSKRAFKSLERALEVGDLVITASPAVYLTDVADGSIDQVQVNADAVEPTTPAGWD